MYSEENAPPSKGEAFISLMIPVVDSHARTNIDQNSGKGGTP